LSAFNYAVYWHVVFSVFNVKGVLPAFIYKHSITRYVVLVIKFHCKRLLSEFIYKQFVSMVCWFSVLVVFSTRVVCAGEKKATTQQEIEHEYKFTYLCIVYLHIFMQMKDMYLLTTNLLDRIFSVHDA
jgi:hypothetical protein